MKFLCIPCDQAMKLAEVRPPERGSIAARYACPACGYEMAMLTNAHETQLVSSLGVRIGPAGGLGPDGTTVSPRDATSSNGDGGAGRRGTAGSAHGRTVAGPDASRPSEAARAAEAATTQADDALTGARPQTGDGPGCPLAAMVPGAAVAAGAPAEGFALAWTPAALARLETIPSFVRPMARAGIERFARDAGHAEIDESVLDSARAHFGM